MKADEIRKRFHLEDCMRCGNECARACPVYRFYGDYHPQQLAELFLGGEVKSAGRNPLLWYCVTCRACTEACPYDVEFADFLRELRVGRIDYRPVHEGMIHTFQRLQAADAAGCTGDGARRRAAPRAAGPARLSWVDGALDVNKTPGFALFTGCLPFFEKIFAETCRISPVDMARSSVLLLNSLGVSPVLLEEERCCGRDLYDLGDRDSFRALARHNVKELEGSGAETVLTVCPECAYTLGGSYEEEFGKLPFEVRHITEYLAENLHGLDLAEGDEKLALHESCYLARYLGVIEAPRRIAAALSSERPVEMDGHGRETPCCGAGSWVNHGEHTRALVNERIREAGAKGAKALLTVCPKCMMLFQEVNPPCSWKESPVEVRSLLCEAAGRLSSGKDGKGGAGKR